MPKPGITTSETYTRPHFASHTQSSLMKRRPPINPTKKSSSSTVDLIRSKRSQGSVVPRLNGIHKRRSNIMKQSRNMEKLIMILRQQHNRRATIFLSGSELTRTTCRSETSLVSLQSDLIRDVSSDLKRSTGSPAKLASFHGKLTKVVKNVSEKRAKDSHASPQREPNRTGRDNSENIHDPSEHRAIVDVAHKLQLRLSDDEEESADSRREVEILHCRSEPGKRPDDLPNEGGSEIKTQMRSMSASANAVTNSKRKRKLRAKRARNEHIDVDRACRTDLQASKNTKCTKHVDNPPRNNDRPVVNGEVATRKGGALQKNPASTNQRAWRPPGVPKNLVTESAMSLTQPMSQKSSQSAEKSTFSTKSKHSSIDVDECTSTSMPANQSKVSMKENRDPRAIRMTKICEQPTEAKQRQRLQGGGTLPKKRRSKSKIGILDKRDDVNANLPKSRSRHCQTRPITPKESSNNPNNVKQHQIDSTLIYNKRSEVIHELRKIINSTYSVIEDEDAEESAVSKNDDCEKDDSEIQTSPDRDASSRNNELRIFTKNTDLDEADRSFDESSQRSIGTQTELNSPEIDSVKDDDLKTVLKPTRNVATQTSPTCNRNVVEIGCNTTPYEVVRNDVEVSCNLTSSVDSTAEVVPTLVEDKSKSDVPIRTTESLPVKCTEINIENEDIDESKNRELPLGGCKETLNTQMSLKLETCGSMEVPAKTSNDTTREPEEIMYEKVSQLSSISPKNSDEKTNIDLDKHQESTTRCSNNHDANNSSVNNLFLESSPRPSIYNYASCSSDEVTEYLENDVQYEDIVAPKLKVESIPSDVIAAFELAAERARNLHEAVIIYHKNLMSRQSEKRNEETVEDYETPKVRDYQHCPEEYAPFMFDASFSRENEDEIKSECEAIYHFVNNGEDFGGFSTCSSRGSSSDQACEFAFPRSSRDDHSGIEREEKIAVLARGEKAAAKSILNERSDLEEMRSLMQLLVDRTQEEYALELLSARNGNDESFEMERVTGETLALPAAIEETSFMSRENLLPLIYCVVCTVVFWYLQFSFRCDSTK